MKIKDSSVYKRKLTSHLKGKLTFGYRSAILANH